MRSVRPASLVLLAMFAASGCRTAGLDPIAERDPIGPKASVDVNEIIAEHNRNAERIETLEARPSIKVTDARQKGYGVDGKLALERPRNFKLEIDTSFYEVADIGSNDEKFWFWIRDAPEKAVYYCHYDETGSTPLVATLQPDWIVEALGLRKIEKDEAKEIKVSPGEQPGTVILTYKPAKTGGEMVVRKTVISERSRQILEHRLYSEKGGLLARATIDGYQRFPASPAPGEKATVFVPRRVKLEWVRERLTMDVTLQKTVINTPFSDQRRSALFVEEERKGYSRVNLADVAKRPEPRIGGGTSIRETRPIPPAGGVELGDPAPIGIDGASKVDEDPIALSADLPAMGSLKDTLVGAPSIVPASAYASPSVSAGWRTAAQPTVEY